MTCIVVLDNIRSVHNVGSMFRTANSAGVEHIYLCGITPTPTDRFGKIRQGFDKVALGAEKTVAWTYKKSTSQVLINLKKDGYTIIAVEQSPRASVYDAYKPSRSQKKIALVMGNEVKGIGKAICEKADTILEIPQQGTKESLNVVVAFGIVVFYITRYA